MFLSGVCQSDKNINLSNSKAKLKSFIDPGLGCWKGGHWHQLPQISGICPQLCTPSALPLNSKCLVRSSYQSCWDRLQMHSAVVRGTDPAAAQAWQAFPHWKKPFTWAVVAIAVVALWLRKPCVIFSTYFNLFWAKFKILFLRNFPSKLETFILQRKNCITWTVCSPNIF